MKKLLHHSIFVVFTIFICGFSTQARSSEPIGLEKHNQTVAIKRGQNLVIRLDSLMTAGYVWRPLQTTALGEPTKTRDTSTCPSGVVGCSGYEFFTWENVVVENGSYNLQFLQSRFGTQPYRTFRVTITVSDSAESELPDEVTIADHGGEFVLSQPKDLVVKLDSHQTSGYLWKIISANGLGDATKRRDTSECPPPPTTGCAGKEIFVWKTEELAPGTYEIILFEERFDGQVLNQLSFRLIIR
jgi:predicted secreted protein